VAPPAGKKTADLSNSPHRGNFQKPRRGLRTPKSVMYLALSVPSRAAQWMPIRRGPIKDRALVTNGSATEDLANGIRVPRPYCCKTNCGVIPGGPKAICCVISTSSVSWVAVGLPTRILKRCERQCQLSVAREEWRRLRATSTRVPVFDSAPGPCTTASFPNPG
jgi:hypothetical protein